MNWRRAFVGVLASVPFVALLGWGTTRDPHEIPSPLPGRAAPAFDLEVFARGSLTTSAESLSRVKLETHRGEIVVLNFWASWCLACRSEHRTLSSVAERLHAEKADDIYFYGVLYNDSRDAGVAWINEMGGQAYPSLLDPGSRTAIDYGLYGVPETFFIGRDGRVAYKHIGPVTEALLTRVIDSLRALPVVSGP
jgi:cytochrome c biogenesis protein CcmG, thiol:disulfide interchange protein DsbE